MEGWVSILFFTLYILNNVIKIIADANWCHIEGRCGVFKRDDLLKSAKTFEITSNNCENLPKKKLPLRQDERPRGPIRGQCGRWTDAGSPAEEIHSHKTSTEGGNLTSDTRGAGLVRLWPGSDSTSHLFLGRPMAALRSGRPRRTGAVDPRVRVSGRGANMNHAQYVGVQDHWCGLG